MKRLFILFIFTFLAYQSYATHYRAGEIRLENVKDANGNPTLTYNIYVTTYTRFSEQTDRCELTLIIGNKADSITLKRINGLPAVNNSICNGKPGGELINGNVEFKKNVYMATRTFTNGGVYKLYMSDKNRMDNVMNIELGKSVYTPFTIETELNLSVFGFNNNSSPVFTNSPLDKACNLKCFYHNPGAVDPDGDSLAYFIDTCRGEDFKKIPGYSLPPSISIKPDGTFEWCSPTNIGVYNFAIRIEEYRKVNGVYRKVAYVIRDFQVDVVPCLNNPPDIFVTDTCVVGGSSIVKQVKATDGENNLITMSAAGEPFKYNPVATFSNVISAPGIASSVFSWQTQCSQIRRVPYNIVIKAIDNANPTELTKYKSFNIRVIGSPVKSLSLNPLGNSVILNWQKPNCAIAKTSTTVNGITGYGIYRKTGCDTLKFDPCSPLDTSNYKLVGKVNSVNTLTFTDNNNGTGLPFGQAFSYLVVPIYFDGAYAKVSQQLCITLLRSIPAIINVDVRKTDISNGEIYVRWLKPLIGGLGKLDTVQYPGPYVFELKRFEQGNNNQGTTVYTVTKPHFKSIKSLTDTTFTDIGINTQGKGYEYQVDFYVTPAKTALGNSGKAQSVFLKAKGNNKKMVLSWNNRIQPWKADTSYVYQKNSSGQFVLINKKIDNTDTVFNLVNGREYCFKVICRGKFGDEGIIYNNLYDSSQIACEKPNDLAAPCDLGNLSLAADCENSQLLIKYDFAALLNCDTADVMKFKVWRSSTDTGKFVAIDSILNKGSRSYLFQNSESLAGCYAITAIDSSGNESKRTNKICIDNCDFQFDLPNIFTPNKDTINDLYTPVKKEVRFVNKLDFKIYNRWGLLVYETNDILINWNGNIKNSGQKCPDGVYFYVGSATIARLRGDEIKKFTGFIHLQRSEE